MNKNDPDKPKQVSWWKVLLILSLLPFFLTYWILKQPWEKNSKLLAITILWLGVLFFGGLYRIRSLELENEYKQSRMIATQPTSTPLTPTDTPSPSPLISPSAVATPTPTPIPQVSYDSSYGNNYIAAREAENFLNIMNGAVPGFITDIYLELAPSEIDRPENEYISSVSSIFLQVRVSSSLWYTMNEGQQKDVVTVMTTSIQKAVGHGYPHVTVSNGARTVAEGSISFLGEPKVEIK